MARRYHEYGVLLRSLSTALQPRWVEFWFWVGLNRQVEALPGPPQTQGQARLPTRVVHAYPGFGTSYVLLGTGRAHNTKVKACGMVSVPSALRAMPSCSYAADGCPSIGRAIGSCR